MQRFTTTSQTTEFAPVTAEAECVSKPTEPGRRLSEARSADREWRGTLALRMHRRLAKLRKSDQLIQQCGVGVSGLMLASAFAMPLWARGARAGMNLFILLILGALLCAVGSLGLIAGIGWCEDSLRNWLAKTGLTEAEAPVAVDPTPSQKPWYCTACRTRNKVSAGTCSGCGCEKRAEESRLLSRVTEIESSMSNVVGIVLLAMLAGILLLFLGLLLNGAARL